VWLRLSLPVTLAVLALPAAARTYCCTDDNHRRVCGDILPAQCLKRGYQEYNAQGVLAKEYAAPLTPEQRAQHDAEIERQKVEERHVAERARWDRTLLTRYNSVADIEARRSRLMGDASGNVQLAQERLDAALARKQKLQKDAAAFGTRKLPESLVINIRDNESQVTARQATLADRKRDLADLEASFDAEKKRFLELTAPKPPAPPTR
jgi:hypothetical protein